MVGDLLGGFQATQEQRWVLLRLDTVARYPVNSRGWRRLCVRERSSYITVSSRSSRVPGAVPTCRAGSQERRHVKSGTLDAVYGPR